MKYLVSFLGSFPNFLILCNEQQHILYLILRSQVSYNQNCLWDSQVIHKGSDILPLWEKSPNSPMMQCFTQTRGPGLRLNQQGSPTLETSLHGTHDYFSPLFSLTNKIQSISWLLRVFFLMFKTSLAYYSNKILISLIVHLLVSGGTQCLLS
jgi:hypothetical protein